MDLSEPVQTVVAMIRTAARQSEHNADSSAASSERREHAHEAQLLQSLQRMASSATKVQRMASPSGFEPLRSLSLCGV